MQLNQSWSARMVPVAIVTGTLTMMGSVGYADEPPSPTTATKVGVIKSTSLMPIFYKFDLTQSSAITVTLNTLFTDLDLALYNATGEELDFSEREGMDQDQIRSALPAGRYYIGLNIAWEAPETGIYKLSLDTTAGSPQVFEGTLDPQQEDYVSVVVADERKLQIDLKNLTANVDLHVVDPMSDEYILDSSKQSETSSESIQATLDSGAYRMMMISEDEVASTYRLIVDGV
jgi:hypothetical protein